MVFAPLRFKAGSTLSFGCKCSVTERSQCNYLALAGVMGAGAGRYRHEGVLLVQVATPAGRCVPWRRAICAAQESNVALKIIMWLAQKFFSFLTACNLQRDPEGWKAQRRASIQRMRSSMPQPEEDARNQDIDPVMLSTAGRFAQFPRMVDALGSPADVAVSTPDLRQPRGLAGDDMFAPATPNAAARRRSSAPPRRGPQYDPRERRWTNDEPAPMQQRDPQDEWDSHVASVVQRRSQGTQSPPAMAYRALRTRRRSAPPPPPYQGQHSYAPTPLRSTRQPLPQPQPPQPSSRQPYADTRLSIEPASVFQRRQKPRQRHQLSSTPNDLISDATMYLPGQCTGTIDLDGADTSTTAAAAFAQDQPQWPQAYTAPGRGWQRVPVHDPDPPPRPPRTSPPPPQQMPLAARYTVNDNDVFVYASCDLRDSPKYRRARLLEATTAAAASPRQTAAGADLDGTAGHSVSAYSSPLTTTLPASAGLMHAGGSTNPPVDAGHPDSSVNNARAEASEAAVDNEGASSEPGGDGAAAAGASVWAQLLQTPREPQQEASKEAMPRSGGVAAGAALGPSGIWQEILTREGGAVSPSRADDRSAGRGEAGQSAAAPAMVAAVVAGAAAAPESGGATGAEAGVPGSAAGLPLDASASVVPVEGAQAEKRYGSDSTADGEPAAAEVDDAAAAAVAAPAMRVAVADDLYSAELEYVDGEGGAGAAGIAAQAAQEVADASHAGVLPRGVEPPRGGGLVQEGAEEDAGLGAGPEEAWGREERPSATAPGLPSVAVYAGVGPVGSALFINPTQRGAAAGREERRGAGESPPVDSAAAAAVPSCLPDAAAGAGLILEDPPMQAGGGADGGTGERWAPEEEGQWERRDREQGVPMVACEAEGEGSELHGATWATGAAGDGVPPAAALPADATAIVLATPTVEAPDVAQGCVLPDTLSPAGCY